VVWGEGAKGGQKVSLQLANIPILAVVIPINPILAKRRSEQISE
jgi:hypothetical protein